MGDTFFENFEKIRGVPNFKTPYLMNQWPNLEKYGINKKGKRPGIQTWHHFCDVGKFWGDDLLTYILTLELTPWIKS